MLTLFRKHATSWVIKIAFFLIIVVFIFWGGYSAKEQRANQIALVGDDHYISINEYNEAYNNLLQRYREQFKGSLTDEMLKQMNLKEQALEMLVTRYLVGNAANEMRLSPGVEEIQKKILEVPAFQGEDGFDRKRYTAILKQNRLTPEAFEAQVARDLMFQKVEDFIKRSAVVTEDEIRADFLFNNTQVRVSFAAYNARNFEDQVVVDEAALQKYFDDHKERYLEPEKREIGWVAIKTQDFTGDVRINEDEIRQYYDERKEEFHHEKEVRARHILIAVKPDASAEEDSKARAEAERILEEARKGANFADLAMKFSQDPGSAKNGGDLNFFKRGQMVAPFAEAAFSAAPGEITGPVRTTFGYHIIKVEDIRQEHEDSLEEARPRIEATLKEQKAREIAYSKAREFMDRAYALRDIRKAAEAQKLTLMGSGSMLSQRDTLPGVEGTAGKIMGKLFSLQDREVSEVLDIPQGYLIAQVLAIRMPQVPPLEQAKEKVLKDYKLQQATEIANRKASDLLESARKASSLDTATKTAGVEEKTTEWFNRKEPDKGIKPLSADALNMIFAADQAHPFPDAPIQTADRLLVFQLLEKRIPDEKLNEDRTEILNRLVQEKQTEIWQAWLTDLRARTKVEKMKEL